MSSKLVLHHLGASRSVRTLWLLEELKVPYEVKVYNRENGPANDGLKSVHPLGRSPVLEDGELKIAESGSQFQYLLEHYSDGKSPLGPKPSEKSARAVELNFWLHFSEASLMLHGMPLFYYIRSRQGEPSDGTALQEQIIARGLKADLDYIEDQLTKNGGTLLGGNQLSAADIMLAFGVDICEALIARPGPSFAQNTKLSVGSATKTWLAKCKAAPGYKEALRKEGRDPDSDEHYMAPMLGGGQKK